MMATLPRLFYQEDTRSITNIYQLSQTDPRDDLCQLKCHQPLHKYVTVNANLMSLSSTTVTFAVTRISFQHSIGQVEGSPYAKISDLLNLFSHFNRTPDL